MSATTAIPGTGPPPERTANLMELYRGQVMVPGGGTNDLERGHRGFQPF